MPFGGDFGALESFQVGIASWLAFLLISTGGPMKGSTWALFKFQIGSRWSKVRLFGMMIKTRSEFDLGSAFFRNQRGRFSPRWGTDGRSYRKKGGILAKNVFDREILDI